MRPGAGLVLAVLLLPCAQAAAGSEYAILNRFLATFDIVPGLAHCAREGGHAEPDDLPPLPVRSFNATNRLLDEHVQWHSREQRVLQGRDLRDDAVRYGDDFWQFHRMMIQRYDAWRATDGDAPTPAWDPNTTIPDAYAYDVPTACAPRSATVPLVPLPTWLTVEGGAQKDPLFNYTSLCQFPDLNRLAKSIDFSDASSTATMPDPTSPQAYHAQVHAAVGGDMPRPETSLRDPIFWGWHKDLDQRFHLWETSCQPGSASAAPVAVVTRAVPAPGPLVAIVALAIAATRRR